MLSGGDVVTGAMQKTALGQPKLRQLAHRQQVACSAREADRLNGRKKDHKFFYSVSDAFLQIGRLRSIRGILRQAKAFYPRNYVVP